MDPAFVLEGSGEELLAHADQWKNRSRLKLVEVPEEAKTPPEIDYAARLPAGTVWKGGVPQFPHREDAEPITLEKIKEWLDED